jgi:shikimate dehydrogenase
MIRAGVIGSPARHSLSPLIHNAWLKAAGIDGLYDLYDIQADEFIQTVDTLRSGGLAGLNVTLPFKEAALALADGATDVARRAGAANVLVFKGPDRVEADNTDGLGLLAAFAEQAPGYDVTSVATVILGAGGAARGAAAALIEAGSPCVRIVNRTHARAAEIAAELGDKVETYSWADAATALDGAGALINATSLGLAGGQPLVIDLDPLPQAAPVMDMVYKPLLTPLLLDARARGHKIVDGLAMLIGQARPSFKLFFGQTPDPTVDVRALVLEVLNP